VVPGFDMPVKVTTAPGELGFLEPSTRWKSAPLGVPAEQFRVDPDFYVAVLKEP
jgi:hypothetical protein